MRVIKGFLSTEAPLIALTDCQDAMKENEVYPTTNNLTEIDSERLKIMEVTDSESGIPIILGESHNRSCEVAVLAGRLEKGTAVSSLLEKESVTTKCLWDNKQYIQSTRDHTVVTASVHNKITIDLQLYNPSSGNYLALTNLSPHYQHSRLAGY
jgi:hypothetical protein